MKRYIATGTAVIRTMADRRKMDPQEYPINMRCNKWRSAERWNGGREKSMRYI